MQQNERVPNHKVVLVGVQALATPVRKAPPQLQSPMASWSTGQAPLPCKWSGSNADLFTLNHRPSNAMCFHMQGPRVLSMTAVSFCAFHPCAVAMNMPMSTI